MLIVIFIPQVLPVDYDCNIYKATHLLWPELLGSNPLSKIAAFTLTNMAPMNSELFESWRRAVLVVRNFARQHCGIPVIHDEEFIVENRKYQNKVKFQNVNKHYKSAHPTTEPAIYLVSGAVPYRHSSQSTPSGLHLPFMFWMAACCVLSNNTSSKDSSFSHDRYADIYDTVDRLDTGKHLSFAMYARNLPLASTESGRKKDMSVIFAPILKLEMILQDMHKILFTDPNVDLFLTVNAEI